MDTETLTDVVYPSISTTTPPIFRIGGGPRDEQDRPTQAGPLVLQCSRDQARHLARLLLAKAELTLVDFADIMGYSIRMELTGAWIANESINATGSAAHKGHA